MGRPQRPSVVIAATPRGWASRLHAYAADHGGVVVRTTVLTSADAVSERADVVVVDDICSFLSRATVQALRRAGRGILGIHEAGDAEGIARLADLGITTTAAADIDGADLVRAIADVASSARTVTTDLVAVGSRSTSSHGAVVGVTGPPGGVGVTEVAVELAALIAETGRPTVVVDLDETAPATAQRLALPLQPNVLNALDAAGAGRRPDEVIRALSRRTRLGTLTGMADPADWAAVAEDAVMSLLDGMTADGTIVVADLGHCPATVHTSLGRRYGHASAVAASCAELVMVAAPSPVSVSRSAQLRSRLDRDTTVRVLLNRDTGSAFVRGECASELTRCLQVTDVGVLPEDRRVAQASWEGRRVSRGPFARALRDSAQGWGWLG